MSDFLTSLAARTIAAPSLRPRTRSRFEPAEGEPALPVAAIPGRREAIARAMAPPPREPVSHAAELQPLTAGVEPVERHDAMEIRTPREERRREPHSEVRTETVLDTVERVIETHDTVEIHDTRTITQPLPSPAPAAPAPDTRLVRRSDDAPPATRHQPREDAAQPPPPRPDATRDIRERVITRREAMPAPPPRTTRPRPRAAAAEPAASPEPVIHVSIGRVEVRAVTARETPQRTPKRSPVMTIDDYVAKRNAKERR